MHGNELEVIVTRFQALVRGYLIREEVRRASVDFEEIVKEIDGSLAHLRWTNATVSIPYFIDNLSPHQPGVSFSKRSESGLRVGDPQRSPALSEERKELCVLLERKEAERDGSHRCLPRRSAAEEDQQQKFVGDADEEVMESTRRSSSIWGSLEIDLNSYPNKGSQHYCLAEEVPRTPQALRLHRNTLTMELVWLQQAIDSRKKYLSLKDRLTQT
ncbi:IQ domain-containing protein C [Oryzias latipes]|uniref:IQ domain-containing protein C n=1 Tax=Oryzias latipes TaxID=8090 RepID=UPI0002A480C8|nr:IQ domain-containing protein C [Oryzias latipes]